ncbi:MAG: MATE family efflux transporter, partial [Rheinheimera sp.]|nr:MATE family efflux transporter [Rheinheimera sp.]
LHQPGSALILSVIRLFVFYVPLAWLGGRLFGITGLFFGCVVANIITASLAWSWFNWSVQRTSQEATI